MKRRTFLKIMSGLGAALFVPASWILERLAPARWVEAVRGRSYPGPTGLPDEAEIRRPGHWAG